jgi:hypothetical protein
MLDEPAKGPALRWQPTGPFHFLARERMRTADNDGAAPAAMFVGRAGSIET